MSSQVEIRAPAQQTEGTRSQILRWLKGVGEQVTENEPLIEIETDKVTVEVAAPGSGTLREIVKQEQDEIGPGELLGMIEARQGAPLSSSRSPGLPPERSAVAEPAAPIKPTAPTGANTGSSLASLQTPPVETSSAPASAPPSVSAPPAQDRGATSSLSPAVRRLIAERGLEASSIRGTGQGGRISVEDVLTHVGAGKAAGSAPAAASSTTAEAMGPSHRVPHTNVRKRIAEHMVRSLLHTAPHVTTVFEADLSAVLKHRERHKEEFAQRGAPLTLTAYFLDAAVAALREVPEANSRWSDAALEIFDSVHIGIATALETGLVVPVLHDVQSRDLSGIAAGLHDLVSRAREGRLAPSDVRGGTFTISNHGVSGSLLATPIVINQPQAAILGIGKLEKRVVVADGPGEEQLLVQPRCYVTLTIDHRVMDGHQANRFLQTFVQRLASLER